MLSFDSPETGRSALESKKLHEFGLYIHWPFCLSKCPYCDFNSHVRDQVDYRCFQEALLQEMRWMAQQLAADGQSFQLRSIFFGGGTPSLMVPQTVGALIREALALWPTDIQTLEITLEANPTSVEAEKFFQFRENGINRLSLGIQSLRSNHLTFLGREHTTAQSHQALMLAASIFPRFSFDLIYALPNQSPADWETELNEALATYCPSHLSLYQLTYEPGTPFYTRFGRGELNEPPEEIAVELYQITQQCTRRYGLELYEVSNYAVPGTESRHNLGYWQGKPYVGIGPGAHGRLKVKGKTQALETHKLPEKWLRQVEQEGHGVASSTLLTPQQRFLELFSMGLRLREGVLKRRLLEETGIDLEDSVLPQALERLEEEGFLYVTPETLCLTPQGRLRLNAVLAYCLKG